MFGFVKKIFHRSDSPEPSAPAPVAAASGAEGGAAGSGAGDSVNQEIALPLKELLDCLSEETKVLVQGIPNSDVFIFLPRTRVTSQLSKGKVELTVGEIRKYSPQGVFAKDNSFDETSLTIPFPLIIQRLKSKNPPKESSHLGAITPVSAGGAPEKGKSEVEEKVADATETMEAPPSSFMPGNIPPPGSVPPPGMSGGIPVSPIAASFDDDDLPDVFPGIGGKPKAEAGGVQDDDGGDEVDNGDALFAPVPPPGAGVSESSEPSKPISFGGQGFVVPKGPISPIASGPDEGDDAVLQDESKSGIAAKLNFGLDDGDDADLGFAPPPPPGAYSSPPPSFTPPPPPVSAPPPAPAAFGAVHPPSAPLSPFAGPSSTGGESKAVKAGADHLEFPLVQLWEKWPEAVKHGLEHLEHASVKIPVSSLTPILQRGKAVFPWNEVRSWLGSDAKPTLLAQEEKTELVFPMGTLVPAYMKVQQAGKSSKKLDTQEMDSIPDLFGGSAPAPVAPPPPSAPPPAPAAPSVAPPLGNQLADSKPAVTEKVPAPPAVSGIETVSAPAPSGQAGGGGGKEFSPLQLVQEAVKFSEVIGAFLASSDGLLIHGELPEQMKQETFAAFIPQMYDRVSKYTRELRQGDLRTLSLTFGETGMVIMKTDAIYFAALSKSADTLPLAELAKLVASLKTK